MSRQRPERPLCVTARSAWCGRYNAWIRSFGAFRQAWVAEGFLDATGSGGADALVDRVCLVQQPQAFVVAAVLEVGLAESFQGAGFFQGRADVTGDSQRLRVVRAGLRGVCGPDC